MSSARVFPWHATVELEILGKTAALRQEPFAEIVSHGQIGDRDLDELAVGRDAGSLLRGGEETVAHARRHHAVLAAFLDQPLGFGDPPDLPRLADEEAMRFAAPFDRLLRRIHVLPLCWRETNLITSPYIAMRHEIA
jgi:hypothetical protein